jgi:hypothetical protein
MFRLNCHHQEEVTILLKVTAIRLQYQILKVKNVLVNKHATGALNTPFEHSDLFHESQLAHEVMVLCEMYRIICEKRKLCLMLI